MYAKGVTLIRKKDAVRIHTFDDWGLILKERPVIGAPEPKTSYVDVPGADGCLDFTEVLTGEVVYDQRVISMTFYVACNKADWPNLYSEILDFIHGREARIILDDDLWYYYVGRVSVENWISTAGKSELTMKVAVEPYKLEYNSSAEDWEWDHFDFQNGIARELKYISVSEALDVVIEGTRKKVIPSFAVYSGDLNVTCGKSTYHLPIGITVPGLALGEGDNTLHFTGVGVVTIDYRGGRL